MWSFGIVLYEMTVAYNPSRVYKGKTILYAKPWDNINPDLKNLV